MLQTKVDRDMATGDYSGDRVRRSVHESLERLGLERLGLVHLHDPEKISFEAGGPLEAAGCSRAPQSKGCYGYREAATELLARIEAIEAACRRHEVPLAAAALQFSLRDTRIVSTVVGASRPERIDGLLELAGTSIPPELWDELGRLN